jgi:DNA end-binding protein Ku
MPRTLWRGSLSFGLVNVPVALVPAVKDLDVHFNQLHKKTNARLEVKRTCKKECEEVPYEEIGNAYELDNGKLVILTDDELESAQPEKTRTIDISEFVPEADIDPVYFDHPYFVVPDETGEGPARAYRLLVEAMKGSDRAAIGSFVLRTREHVVALRVRDDLLQVTTMVFADEVRPVKDLPLPTKKDQPSKKELDNALALVQELSADFDPKKLKDRHRDRLLKIIERKRKGQTIKAPAEPEAPKAVPDLMKALEESLAEVRGKSKKAKAGAR